jgi:hypothetical protein
MDFPKHGTLTDFVVMTFVHIWENDATHDDRVTMLEVIEYPETLEEWFTAHMTANDLVKDNGWGVSTFGVAVLNSINYETAQTNILSFIDDDISYCADYGWVLKGDGDKIEAVPPTC